MKNLLTASEFKAADAYTIENEPISSIDLMERASQAFVKVFKKEVTNKKSKIAVFCGQGNNGGDGLAIARLLVEEKYQDINVYVLKFAQKQSDEFNINLKRLKQTKIKINKVDDVNQLKNLEADIIIDAILGTGLSKPLQGNFAEIAKLINNSSAKIIAVDVPTGFNCEGEIPINYLGVKADLVISFQLPKINFFFPESIKALKKFKIVDIGLAETFFHNQKTNWKLTDISTVKKIIKPRENFTHKGTYGHALIVAGNEVTMGAGLLTANACLHSGAGLTTLCLPQSGLTALNTTLPEVMALSRYKDLANNDFNKYSIIAIGPGLGTSKEERDLLVKIIKLNMPLVIDADGLNILSNTPNLINQLAEGCVLTPHMKEFDRLFGEHKSWWDRVQTASEKAKTLKSVIILKNQYSFVCLPNGDIHINLAGNPAMASGGMGDVLTGIITALIAQKYSPEEATILGAYLHGKAGDELAKKRTIVTASQIAKQIPKTIRKILKNKD
jgi:NAD(P)H-hydrate epimerase